MTHTHVTREGERIEHEHPDHQVHYHDQGGIEQVYHESLSIYYPPLPNGEPDPRGQCADPDAHCPQRDMNGECVSLNQEIGKREDLEG